MLLFPSIYYETLIALLYVAVLTFLILAVIVNLGGVAASVLFYPNALLIASLVFNAAAMIFAVILIGKHLVYLPMASEA